MKREIELALQNIDSICAGVNLNRAQHAELARNVQLVHTELVAADIKKAKKDGKPKTDV